MGGGLTLAAPLPYQPLSVVTSQRLLELRHGLDLFPWLRPRDGRALAALEPVGAPWWHTVCTFAWPPQLDAGMTDGELAVECLGGCVFSDAVCVCLVWCAAAALASSDPAELVWLLAEQLEAADSMRVTDACHAFQKLLTKQPDNKVRALAVGASAVLTRLLVMYHVYWHRRSAHSAAWLAYSAAVSAWLALTLTPDQGTRAVAGNPP